MVLMALLVFSLLFITFFTKFYEKKYGYMIPILFFSIFLLIAIIGTYFNFKKADVENYQQELQEIKAQQYDLIKKNASTDKIKKNEKKIVEATEKYNKKAKIYNKMLERDEKRFILFRSMICEEKYPIYEVELTTEYYNPN